MEARSFELSTITTLSVFLFLGSSGHLQSYLQNIRSFSQFLPILRISYPPQFRSEMAAQAMQELVQKMTDKCFIKCTGKSGNRLESKVKRGKGGQKAEGGKGRGGD